MDVFDVLRHDHEVVEELLVQLEDLPSAAGGATREQLAVRRALAERLVMEESRHEAAEEQHFWPVVRAKLRDGDRWAGSAIAQETEGKHVLHELDRTGPDEPEFDRLVTQFTAAARAHISFEQQQVWPRLRAVLTDSESEELGAKFDRARRTGPTRPHPRTPPEPRLLKTAGAAAAVLDRARDALTNRGDPRS